MQCKVCNKELKKFTSHIRVHGMNAEEYFQKYPLEKDNFKTRVERACLICFAATTNHKYCSEICAWKGQEGKSSGTLGTTWSPEKRKRMLEIEDPWWRFQKGRKQTYTTHPMIGKHHSAETKAKNSAIRKLNNPGGFKNGYVPSTKGKTKENHPGIARGAEKKRAYYLNGGKPGFGKPGFYADDLGHHVRSLWEANFARLLKFMQIEYQYEPGRFDLGDTIYIPDFYVSSLGIYVEVKGNFRGRGSLEKVESFSKNHPILVLDSIAYHNLNSKFSKIIPNWGKKGGNKNGSVSATIEASNS